MAIERITLPSEHKTGGCSFLHQHSVSETFHIHTHDDFYELFFVLEGQAIHYINQKNQLLKKGALVLMRPNDVHYYESFNQHVFELISIGFLSSEFQLCCDYLEINPDIFASPSLPCIIELNGYPFSDMKNHLLKIGRLCDQERKTYFRSILPTILCKMHYNHEVDKEIIPDRILKLLDEMDKPENFCIGLTRLLELAHTSQEHVNREFKKYLHLTPTEYINLKRMNYAAKLLSEKEHEIIDICFLCGFNNLSHFYHIFKKIYGCSPKQFITNQGSSI